MAIKMFKRNEPKWWMEEAEKQEISKRLHEEYTGLKAGSDGRNLPSITKSYGKNQVAGAATALGTEKLSISEKLSRMMKEEELEDMPADMNAEPEVPAELEGEDLEGEMEPDAEIEDETSVDVDDITITIDGQTFALTPVDVEGEGEIEGEEFGAEGDLEGGEGFEGEGDLGDEGLEDELEPEEEFPEAKKEEIRKRVREAVQRIKEKKAKKIAEADDLYDWSADLGDEETPGVDAGMIEAKKAKATRIAELKKKLQAKKEEIDNLGGKKLAMDAGQSGSKTNLGAKDLGLEGGNEFSAPRTQGSSSKAAALKVSPSTGRYGEEAKAKVEALRKKFEAKAKAIVARAALAEEEGKNDQENFEIDDGGYDANYPLELGANPDMIEKYRRTKARRAERATKVETPIKEDAKKKLDFGKLLREGFGKDSQADVNG